MDYYAGRPLGPILDKQQFDQALEELHDRYLRADEAERSHVRQCVDALVEIDRKVRGSSNVLCFSGLVIRSAFNLPSLQLDKQGIPRNELIELPVGALARAIAAWDRGELYAPEERDLIGE